MRLIPQALIWITTPEDGVEYDMTGYAERFWVGDSGLGMPPVRRIEERGPQQHGATDLGFRLDVREFSIVFGFPSTGGLIYWQKRREILDIFKPSDDPLLITLQSFDTEDFKRAIEFHYLSDLELSTEQSADIDEAGTWDLVAVRLRAPEAVWFDPTQKISTIETIDVSGMNIDTEVPTFLGGTLLAGSVDIDYQGSWSEYPVIVITGQITDPIITNTITGEVLDFTGYTVPAGDELRIDLRYGVKTVVDLAGNNKIGELSADSDLATWHLQHARAGVQTNTIQATGTGTDANAQVAIQYHERYIGV